MLTPEQKNLVWNSSHRAELLWQEKEGILSDDTIEQLYKNMTEEDECVTQLEGIIDMVSPAWNFVLTVRETVNGWQLVDLKEIYTPGCTYERGNTCTN